MEKTINYPALIIQQKVRFFSFRSNWILRRAWFSALCEFNRLIRTTFVYLRIINRVFVSHLRVFTFNTLEYVSQNNPIFHTLETVFRYPINFICRFF